MSPAIPLLLEKKERRKQVDKAIKLTHSCPIDLYLDCFVLIVLSHIMILTVSGIEIRSETIHESLRIGIRIKKIKMCSINLLCFS